MTIKNPTAPHYLYRAYDPDGLLLYIGCTSDAKRRIAAHRRGDKAQASRLLKVCAERYEVDADPYPGIRAGQLAEQRAIHAEDPLFNIERREQPTWLIHLDILRYLAHRSISRDGLLRVMPETEAIFEEAS